MNESIAAPGGANPPKSLGLIQVARGLAALIVVFDHLGNESLARLHTPFLGDFFQFGFGGVDFFFVLSGFVIFYNHQNDLGTGRVKTYAIKRLIRVFPTYWIVLSLIVGFNAFFPQFGSAHDRQWAVILKSYLLIPQDAQVLNLAWTLCHEILFYLIFACLILARGIWKWLPVAGWLALSIVNLGNVFQGIENPSAINAPNFLFSPLNLEFSLGILAALLFRRISLIAAKWLFFGGIVLFVAMGMCRTPWEQLMFWHRVPQFGIPAFLIVLGAAHLDVTQAVRAPASLRLLGDSSYALYLIHSPILVVALAFGARIFPMKNQAALWLIVLLIVAASTAFYLFFEKPMLSALRRYFLPKGGEKSSDRPPLLVAAR